MTAKPRLLFVTHLFYPAVGGAEYHIKNAGEGLVERGYPVDVMTTDAYSTEAFFMGDKRRITEKTETINGIHVQRFGFRTFGRRVLKRLRRAACRFQYPFNAPIRMWSYGPRIPGLADRIAANDPDIIFTSPLPTMNVYYAHKAARQTGKPLVIIPCFHIHDRCGFYNPIYFQMLRDADIVIALSDMEKDYLVAEAKVNRHKIRVLPPFPLKKEQLTPPMGDKREIRKRYGITEKNVVVYVGQHGYHKNVHRLLEGMRHVWQTCSDTALVIAGGTSDNTKDLKMRAAALNETVGGKVYFIDNFPQEEKNDIFQMADVFVSLSQLESFGIVFVEAMINGIPVIGSKNSVARSVIDEFRTGLLVDPGSATEVAAAITELLQDETMKTTYSKHAIETARRVYDPRHILDQWETIINELITT